MVDALREIGLKPYSPHGAYYVLANVSHLLGTTSKERALFILHRTGVAAVPGNAFYSGGGGQDLVRFCFAKKDEMLLEAPNGLKKLM